MRLARGSTATAQPSVVVIQQSIFKLQLHLLGLSMS